MEPITIKSAIDFNAYFKLGLSRMFTAKRLLVPLGYLLFLNIVAFYDAPFDWTIEWTLIGATVLVVGVILPITLWIKCKWIMKKHPMFLEGATYQVDENTIAYTNESSSGSSNWKYITKALETDTHFLLYTNSKSLHFFSKNGFSSSTDIERFKEMVKANNVKARFKS